MLEALRELLRINGSAVDVSMTVNDQTFDAQLIAVDELGAIYGQAGGKRMFFAPWHSVRVVSLSRDTYAAMVGKS